jgi:hypothetical protein
MVSGYGVRGWRICIKYLTPILLTRILGARRLPQDSGTLQQVIADVSFAGIEADAH